jgi:hypothetical protein
LEEVKGSRIELTPEARFRRWIHVVQSDHPGDEKRRGKEGAHRAPQPRPECERKEYQQGAQRQLSSHDVRRHEMPLERRQYDEKAGGDQRVAERGKYDQAGHEECHGHDHRPDIGQEIQRKGGGAPHGRIGQADQITGKRDDQPDADVDRAGGRDVAGQTVLDFVEDAQRAQSRLLAAEEHDEMPPEMIAAHEEEEQRREEHEELPDRRRQERQNGLDERGDLYFQPEILVARRQRPLHVTERRKRLPEDLQPVLDGGCNIRGSGKPINERCRREDDDEVDRGDDRPHGRESEKPCRHAVARRVDLERSKHGGEHECGHDGQNKAAGQIEESSRQQQENSHGRHACGRGPESVGGQEISAIA